MHLEPNLWKFRLNCLPISEKVEKLIYNFTHVNREHWFSKQAVIMRITKYVDDVYCMFRNKSFKPLVSVGL